MQILFRILPGIFDFLFTLYSFFQCCGVGAGGVEIILGPGAGAENKFKKIFSADSFEDARMKKRSFLPL